MSWIGLLLVGLGLADLLHSVRPARLLPEVGGTLYRIRASQDYAEELAHWGEHAAGSAAMLPPEQCWALRRGQPHSAAIASNELDCQHVANLASQGYTHSICVPMQAQGEVIGLFHLRSKAQTLPRGLDQLAATVAEHVTLSLSNLMLRDNLRSQSIRDPLTGVFNRRYMEEAFTHELHRAIRREAQEHGRFRAADHRTRAVLSIHDERAVHRGEVDRTVRSFGNRGHGDARLTRTRTSAPIDDIGDLKARSVLDFFVGEIGPSVYNQAILDAQATMTVAVADIAGNRYEPEFDYWKRG